MRQDIEGWPAAARTPETRAQIRRWLIVSGVFFVLMAASAVGLVVTLALSIGLALFGSDPPWWGPVLLVALVAWFFVLSRQEAAGFVYGEEAVGINTDVTVTTVLARNRIPPTTG